MRGVMSTRVVKFRRVNTDSDKKFGLFSRRDAKRLKEAGQAFQGQF